MTIIPWHRNVQRKGTLTYTAIAGVKNVLEAKREFHMATRVNTKISTGQHSLAL